MTNHHRETSTPEGSPGSLLLYSIGFGLSIVLTLTAYFAVTQRFLGGSSLVAAIVSLGLAQLMIQLRFFLHLGHESKPRWNLLAFAFMVLVVLILVFGSLWIMNHLNYNMHLPSDSSIIHDEGMKQ
jgi:cytochrome o ubiquinol oxidase operon protein cyoD